MMEKYGVDMDLMPPTDEQLRKIKAVDKNIPLPGSFKEAQEILSKFEKTGDE